jgi:hypothetical protein
LFHLFWVPPLYNPSTFTMQSSQAIPTIVDSAPPMPGAFVDAAFRGATLYPSTAETYHVRGVWEVELGITTGSGDRATTSLRTLHYVQVSELPGISELLGNFTVAHISGPINLHLFPRAADVDLVAAVVPLPWTQLRNAANRTFTSIVTIPGSQVTQWRTNVTIPLASDILLEFPRNAITTSLIGVGPGVYSPALVLGIRNAESATHTISDGALHMVVSFELSASGRGLLGFPA